MNTQRPPGGSPPGGSDEPTQDPQRPQQTSGGEAARVPAAGEPWADSDRTQAYTPRRRSIVERLAGPERDDPNSGERSADTQPPGSLKPQASPQAFPQGQKEPGKPGAPPPRGPGARHAAAANRGAGERREGKGLRFVLIIGVIVVVGIAAGAAAAWVSGWRPGFLATGDQPGEKPANDKPNTDPQAKPDERPPGDTKPGDPKPGDPPKTPPGGEVTRACFSGTTEVKSGSGACGFALDAAGAVTFKGEVLSAKLGVGGAIAQRLVLYPFSSSGRFVFFRACDNSSGGRCSVQRLADTKEKKLFEVKGGADGFAWVAWSPKESVGLLGFREGGSDAIGAVATGDGRTIKSTSLGTGRNRYALVKQGSMRWRNEESFTVEVKLCPFAKGRTRNKDCEDDDDVRFRRRTIKLSQ